MTDYETVADNLLPAIAYGDAAGLPFEKKPPLEAYSITELHDTETNPFIGQYPAGTWSDDTHLSIAVTKSLMEAEGFDIHSQAAWHVEALAHVKGAETDPDLIPPVVTDKRQNGWGKSTTQSIERLEAGGDPRDSGNPGGAGNGVLMKLAPLLVWQFAHKTNAGQAERELIQLTYMTHRAPEAAVCSLVHGALFDRLMADEVTPIEALASAYRDALDYEQDLDVEPVLSDMLRYLSIRAVAGTLARQDILDVTPKKGFYAPETLAMVYGSFALEPHFPYSVHRAVELGGDSDSVAAVVAPLSLAYQKHYTRPAEEHRITYLNRLHRLSMEFGDATFRARPQ
ncbi:MAG: ADP-ribosylglycohydrolase [Candidatus Saccharibacteria bacterium]|nr:ADP-ribosylglycohydrolase [Candidatus Saccharibacteria bacterium]